MPQVPNVQMHVTPADAGASDDEIKSAIQIAAEVSRFSILLYGNEFGQDELKKVLKICTPYVERESRGFSCPARPYMAIGP